MSGFNSMRIDSHCIYCNIPIDKWEPLNSYPDDKCCQFYSDVWDIADTMEKRFGVINKDKLLELCKILKAKYRDITNFNGAVLECYDSFVDIGVFAIE